jgi:hypothetical protein
MVTKEHLHRLVDTLPESLVVEAAALLEGLGRRDRSTDGVVDPMAPAVFLTEELRQRLDPPTAVIEAPPITSIDELRGNYWPVVDDPNAFIATIRQWRDADRVRNLDEIPRD